LSLGLLFPGQGSQFVGMGKALCEVSAAARLVFDEADDMLGFSLTRLCFEGPEEELKLTVNTQPAILTHSIAAYEDLRARFPERLQGAAFAAGHSLGEYSAEVAAGALRFSDAVLLVRERGVFMQEAVPAGVGAMAAIVGLAPEGVDEAPRTTTRRSRPSSRARPPPSPAPRRRAWLEGRSARSLSRSRRPSTAR
jgi:[acyl-carrier-protein] S-malonyltransferase